LASSRKELAMTSREVAESGDCQIAARSDRRLAEQRVIATEAAREAVRRLRAARGPLMFVQSAGCWAGSFPMCFPEGEYLTGDGGLLLGLIEGSPFYIDQRLCQAWRSAQLVVDIAPGRPEGFSLAAGEDLRFVTQVRA
jgi:uncharacterized protein (DUF779 family)